MISFNPNLTGISSGFKTGHISFRQRPGSDSVVAVRTQAQEDVFERQTSSVASPVKPQKIKKTNLETKSQDSAKTKFLKESLAEMREKRVLPRIVLNSIQTEFDENGKEYFPVHQLKVIENANKRMTFFKSMSKELAAEAENAEPQVRKQMTELFGGEEGLGKYLIIRPKSDTSVFNKFVKEFKEDNFYKTIMNRFSQQEFKKPYKKLSKDEKNILNMAFADKTLSLTPEDWENIEKAYKPSKKDREVATNYIKDLIGTRLILPTGCREEMEQVEKYMSKAIRYKKVNITKMSNYHANYILPYINFETAKKWRDAVPGMELVENSGVRKKNGYTTTQFNILHPIAGETAKSKDSQNAKVSKKAQNIEKDRLKEKIIRGELQIRTSQLNYIGQIEHLIYDILEEKDISKGIPELKAYYKSIGIEDTVNEVFNDAEMERNYTLYEKSMYAWTRHQELVKNDDLYLKPRIEEFGFEDPKYKILSFESLAEIDEEAEKIKTLHKKEHKE